MRYAVAALLLAGIVAGVVYFRRDRDPPPAEAPPYPAVGAKPDSGSYARGRKQGLALAEHDLARGTPGIRRLLDTFGDIESDGVGIDRDTGLPLDNTHLTCGTGLDQIEYDAEIDPTTSGSSRRTRRVSSARSRSATSSARSPPSRPSSPRRPRTTSRTTATRRACQTGGSR